jgi:hypothetical protein
VGDPLAARIQHRPPRYHRGRTKPMSARSTSNHVRSDHLTLRLGCLLPGSLTPKPVPAYGTITTCCIQLIDPQQSLCRVMIRRRRATGNAGRAIFHYNRGRHRGS